MRTEHPHGLQALAKARPRGSPGERLLLVETIPSPEEQKLAIWEAKGPCWWGTGLPDRFGRNWRGGAHKRQHAGLLSGGVARGGARALLGVASWSFSELPTPSAETSEGLGGLDSGRKGPESQGLQRQPPPQLPPAQRLERKTRGKSCTGASHGRCQMLRLLQLEGWIQSLSLPRVELFHELRQGRFVVFVVEIAYAVLILWRKC